MIAAGRAVAGDDPLGIRLGAVLTSLAGPFLLWRTAHILFGGEVARRAVWFALAMPLLAVGGVLITPDTPSVLFWGLAGWALAELHVSGRADWWLAVGLFAGLGLISKYSNLFVGAGIVAWLILLPANWHWLRSWQLWAGGALAACLALPVVIWNAEHGWASFAKQFGRVAANEGLTATYILELAGAYLALAGPIVAVLGIVGLWRVVAHAMAERDQASALLAASILPFLAYLLQHALHDRVQPNWAAPLYPALAVCAALAVAHARPSAARERMAMWARWGIATGLLLSALLYAHTLRPLAKLPGVKDPTSQLRGWQAFASQVDDLRAANGACWIATSSYGTTGQLAHTLRGRVPVLQLDEPLRYVHLPRPRPQRPRMPRALCRARAACVRGVSGATVPQRRRARENHARRPRHTRCCLCDLPARRSGGLPAPALSRQCCRGHTCRSFTVLSEIRILSFMHRAQSGRAFLPLQTKGPVMCETTSEPLKPIQRVREFVVGAVICVGALLMLAGAVSGTVLRLGGPDGLATLWPLYLGGVVAILFGWMNGEWRR